jgi:alpha-L-rhamnosidase
LQADDGSGYFVSLAHGWSSGPTAWLMEQILGIQPTGPGFSTVNIRPDLADLSWAKGAEPTPHGLLKVDVRRDASKVAVAVDVPEGVVAKVAVPVSSSSAHVLVNGKTQKAVAAENGTRMIVTLDSPGHYTLGSK